MLERFPGKVSVLRRGPDFMLRKKIKRFSRKKDGIRYFYDDRS